MMKQMEFITVVVGPLETNCYLVYCPETRECIVNTHGHVDHIGANQDIKDKFAVPLFIHQDDVPILEQAHLGELSFFLQARPSPPPDKFLVEGLEVTFGQQRLKILHTPGHTPGSVSLLGDGLIFSGDTPGGDWSQLRASLIEKILTLPEETIVLPGHGPMTSVGQEKNDNPFLP